MLENLDAAKWEQALEKDPKLRELAKAAGVENDLERAKELNGCFAYNFGKDVVKSEAEKKLAEYMFCIDDGDEGVNSAIRGRIKAARAAEISINDI